MTTMTGKQLKRRRRRLDMSQAQLGERLGVSRECVSYWERETRPRPKWLDLALQALEDENRFCGDVCPDDCNRTWCQRVRDHIPARPQLSYDGILRTVIENMHWQDNLPALDEPAPNLEQLRTDSHERFKHDVTFHHRAKAMAIAIRQALAGRHEFADRGRPLDGVDMALQKDIEAGNRCGICGTTFELGDMMRVEAGEYFIRCERC